MKTCRNCGWDYEGISCPNCSPKEEVKMQPMYSELSELQKLNKNIEEGNRINAEALNAIGQLIAAGSILNFVK